ncbi:16S rRNA (cytosine(967)-C(5))-methyltransferase RsmB [Candidatus Kinetoplastidibacterium galati]|uniref:Ribosomal RNA small subunit methyltransferase B n=1 Tax=Candidatus Kinetoplastidibacterium galati TCC219 TaxID=1208921 RepID=M1M298_9PROT|nr:ribosomal RNA small subunit methyltransferase B [Candidatus Kinetoplastibacterium galatii TCC219]
MKIINCNELSVQLSDTMMVTSHAILEVLQGRSLTCFLDKIDTPVKRSSVQSLSFHAMRYLGWASAVGKCLIKKYPNKLFESLWLLSLTLLKFSNLEKNEKNLKFVPIYKDFVIVNEAVNVTNNMTLLKPYKSLLNAGLRNFLRKRCFLENMVEDNLEACWNYQRWWIDNLRSAYYDSWEMMLSLANIPSQLAIRVNTRQIDRDSVVSIFLENDIDCRRFGDSGIILQKKIISKLDNLVGFSEGWWCVQDAGAQLAGSILGVEDGMSVLDACAAPGGKASHLLELANINLLALDCDEVRLNRMKQNLERLRLYSDNVKLMHADAMDLEKWWDGKLFDAVLADVPCSASGIVRKHPDIRWLRKESDIKKFVLRQIKIIDALWNTVAPGGKMLYVTCSIFYEECIGQALSFLDRHSDAIFLDSPAQILPVSCNNDNIVSHDGFFYALFKKKFSFN